MKYKILLFDVDDTLLDFKDNERTSLKKLFEFYNFSDLENIFDTYKEINKSLWRSFENGEITREAVLNTRFSKTMKTYNINVSGSELEKKYREFLNEGHKLIENADIVCNELSKTHRLFAVTNGVRETQIKRLKMSGLFPYFEKIFDSESIGYQKPSIEFFNHVEKNIPITNKKDVLVIGDSLSSDIKGGINFGIDTCLFSLEKTEKSESTYTITNLKELLNIC